jgi:putative MATE family efflux protein
LILSDQVELTPEPGTDDSARYGNPLSGDSLLRQVFKLALWPFLEQVLGFLVGFVDTALAGRLSAEATDAVGVAAYILWLMSLLISAFAVGSTALIARATGARRMRRANQVLGQSLVIGVIWGVIIGAGFFAVAPLIASVSGLKGQSLELCVQYLRLVSLAAPFTTVLTIGSACLRGSGDTRTPFLVMMLVNVVNIAVGVSLVAESSPFGGWGLNGVAIAAMSAWVVGCMIILIALSRRAQVLHIRQKFLQPRMYVLRRIVRVGIPNLFESFGQWFGNYLVIMIVGHLPEANAVGAHFVAIRIEAMSYLPGAAMGIAAATLTGQYLGAGRPELAKRAAQLCLYFGMSLMTFMGILFIVTPLPFVRIVTDIPVFLDMSPHLLYITGWAQTGFAACLVLSAALRGAGETRTPMIVTFLAVFLIRLPLAWVLGVRYSGGLEGVWIALSLDLVIRGVIFYYFFQRGSWMRVRV